MPTGALRNPRFPPNPIVEGNRIGDVVNYTKRQGKTNVTANFYDVAIIGATGATKIARP
jgi:hypothetical protein